MTANRERLHPPGGLVDEERLGGEPDAVEQGLGDGVDREAEEILAPTGKLEVLLDVGARLEAALAIAFEPCRDDLARRRERGVVRGVGGVDAEPRLDVIET